MPRDLANLDGEVPRGWSQLTLEGGVMIGRIVIDHRVMGGVPCIAGTRVPVATVLGLLGQGYSIDEVLADYPSVTRDDVLAALRMPPARWTSVSCR
jgi:uncharacterized protein (DUF433 family)